jgi:predicted NBD/HSP70 family sugar kinase
MSVLLQKPKIVPPLDLNFCPISLGNRHYLKVIGQSNLSVPLTIVLERNSGCVSVFKTKIAKPGSAFDEDTILYVERLVKFLLWQRGGWKLILAGPKEITSVIQKKYSREGERGFDVNLMERVYEKQFVVELLDDASKAPESFETSVSLGGHLDGCRIGFDLGASDYKLSAVIDGKAVFTTEIPWDPKVVSDPDFHLNKINEGLKLAASHMPRVDAIGGSSAGIYIDNKVMVASLFRAVPDEIFHQKVKLLFLRLKDQWGVPFEVANDGDVTALAGAMSLQTDSLLGIAMGSSQAVGFLNGEGRITGWLNELAFAPIDYHARAATDEWSNDIGCGVQYFSQQAVGRLAPLAGISLPNESLPEQLKFVQQLHEKKDPRAAKVFESIGVYLGYALAQYADMYSYKHVLILGRVTSGVGGDVILEKAQEVLRVEFPELSEKLSLHLPDEKNKRVGQAVAAASLPVLRDK